MLNGRYCTSGMAVIKESRNKMMCVKIDRVKTDEDEEYEDMKAPAKQCLLEGNKIDFKDPSNNEYPCVY